MKSFGFTGTQEEWTPIRKEAVEKLFSRLLKEGVVVQHNGDCIGSDLNSAEIWKSLGGEVHGHPPNINGKRAFFNFDRIETPLPYMDRNTIIAKLGDFLVATPKEYTEQLRSGTWSTVRRARKLNKTIIFVFPDGTSHIETNSQSHLTNDTSLSGFF